MRHIVGVCLVLELQPGTLGPITGSICLSV